MPPTRTIRKHASRTCSRSNRRRLTPAASLLALVCLAPSVLAADPAAEPLADRRLQLGERYPLVFDLSFHSALFHWVDSLAGTSSGKTIEAHREQYRKLIGAPGDVERRWLERFRDVRVSGSLDALRREFLETDDLDAALRAAGERLPAEDIAVLRGALNHFAPLYSKIWRRGSAHRFVDTMAADGDRKRLERLLARIAAFFDVGPVEELPVPRVSVVAVPAGWGTHATAVDRFLLIEVRPRDGLAQQASVITHENAHFLYYRMGKERLERYKRAAEKHSPDGGLAWRLLREALPTALGQGVADRRFLPEDWSLRGTWYHLQDVNAYAKAIYPLVERSLYSGRKLDQKLILEMVDRYRRLER